MIKEQLGLRVTDDLSHLVRELAVRDVDSVCDGHRVPHFSPSTLKRGNPVLYVHGNAKMDIRSAKRDTHPNLGRSVSWPCLVSGCLTSLDIWKSSPERASGSASLYFIRDRSK